MSGTTAGTRPGSRCPGAQGREEGVARGAGEVVGGAQQWGPGVLGHGAVCCSATLPSRLPPASVRRALTSPRQEPDLPAGAARPLPPLRSVLFTVSLR